MSYDTKVRVWIFLGYLAAALFVLAVLVGPVVLHTVPVWTHL